MATYTPAKKNTAYIIYVGLIDQSDTKLLKANPTLASGDFKVSIDGGSFNNLTTLPTVTPASGRAVKISLSSSEMNGDNIFVQCVDAAGAEWCDLCFNIPTAARQIDDLAYPATSGRSMVVDAAGLVDANVVKIGPTGSGTAQTARDIGASVLLSSGTGTGQLDFTSGVVKANAVQWIGGTIPAVNVTGVPLVDAKYLLGNIFSTPTVAGIPNVNAKTWNDLATVALPLVPTTAGRTLDVSATGEAGMDLANVGSPTTVLNLSGTTIKTATDVETDTQDIQSRLPAALGANGNLKADLRDVNGVAATSSGGRPEVNTTHAAGTAWNSGAIGAPTLATDTITASKVADDAIGAGEISAAAVTKIQTGLSTYGGGDTAGTATLLSRLSALRAGYLDNLSGGAVALASGVTLAAGQIAVKKNTALANFPVPMFDQTTGALLAGLTVTAQRRIDSGAFVACANAVTEVSDGFYTINLAAADLNGTTIALKFTATGAKATCFTVVTQP